MDNIEFLRLLKIEFPNKYTLKQYEYNINRFSTKYTNNYYNDISNYEKIINHFNTDLKDKSTAVKHRFISNIKRAIEIIKINVDFKDKLDILCKDLITKRNDEDDEKELKELNFTFEDINECIETFDKDSKEYLYWMILTCLPPRRHDWKNAVFINNNVYQQIEDDETKNYVIVNEEEKSICLTFHNFKTNTDFNKGNSYHRMWQRYLSNTPKFDYNNKIGNKLNPSKLEKILYNLWIKNGKCDNVYILTGTNKPFTDNQMSNFLREKVFMPLLKKGKNVTHNNIRRLFITETLVKNFDTLTIKNKRDICEDMGQYQLQAQQYYISNIVSDDEEENSVSSEEFSDEDTDDEFGPNPEYYMSEMVERKLTLERQMEKLKKEYKDVCKCVDLERELKIIKLRLIEKN
jgi:hypothetical protein